MQNRLLVSIIALTAALSFMSYAETIRLSEPVVSDAQSETFGASLDPSLPDVQLSTLATSSQDYLGRQVQVTTRIAKVCQKKGCFFIAQEGEHALRVSFRDYGFFIPTDSSGKTVTLAGELIQKQVTEAQAEHFNSDLNTGEATVKAGAVYEIVADAIRIPRA